MSDGSEGSWGTILAWVPPHRLVMAWKPNRTELPPTEVEIQFIEQDDGRTRVDLEHRGWERLGDLARKGRDGYAARLDPGVRRAVRGGGERGHVMDTSDLRAAYDRFLQAASSSADCDAVDAAGWTVVMVVAHVATNDRLIAAHLRRAMAGEPSAYDNRGVYRASDLQPIVDADPDVRSQIEGARRSSADVIALAEQMDEDAAAQAFQTSIQDGDIVQVDGPMPLAGLLGAQVRVHLPLHTAQIEALAGA